MVRIPEEYQEVEYIESTGTQYILTNYIPTITEDMKIEMDYMFVKSQGGDSFLFGLKAANMTTSFQCEKYENRAWYCGSGVWQFRNIQLNNAGVLNRRETFLIDGSNMFINDTSASYTEKRTTIATTSLYIFAGNWDGGIKFINTGARIYKLIFTANGVKEADFIPCYRKSDDEIGMYDTVSKQFYTNSGTGTFLKGHNVYYDDVNLLEQRRKILLNTPHLETVSNNIATFNTDMNVSLKDCKIYFSPIQEGEGDPSPENVRPISGWDGITITRCGKNLLDAENPDQDGFVFCYLPKGTKLTYSIEKGTVQIRYYRKDKTEIDYWTPLYTDEISNRKYRSFTLLEDAYYWKTLISTSTKGLKLQLELSNSSNRPTSYELYKESLINISFPQTIYGGYVDLIKGEIVEEWYSIVFDGENIKANSDYSNNDFIRAYWVYFSPAGYNIQKAFCNKLTISYNDSHSVFPFLRLERVGRLYGGLVLGAPEDYPELANGTKADRINAINNWFKENPTQVVYKLRYNIIHSINPQTLKALKGTNNIFSDANGNIQVKFWKH